MKINKYFKLYANCILVKGSFNAIVYDLFLSRNYTLPLELALLIEELDKFTFDEVVSKHDDLKSEITLFCDELVKIGYAEWFDKDELALYPPLSLEWDYPSSVTNLIIESTDFKIIKKLIAFAEEFLTPAILIIYNEIVNEAFLNFLQNELDKSVITHVEIVTPFLSVTDKELNRNVRLKTIWIKDNNLPPENIEGKKVKPLDSKKYFKQDYPVFELFTESQKQNTYFNRKLYIGEKGEIQNGPECEETYGSINDIKNVEELKQIITTPEFQKYWFVHKELCDVCKDCEFRHMCVDNRLPYQRKNGSWYHKVECNYNPYISKWKGDAGYQCLEECGVIVNEKGYRRDDEKIALINKTLWEEEPENA
tara:strand:- start:237 stop:1334 length:1098 start_codon:yes stop_codon:yes gene_type:complete